MLGVLDLKLYQEALTRLVFPASCGLCDLFLEITEKDLCVSCRGKLSELRLPFERASLGLSFRNLTEAWALYPYESIAKDLILAVKFHKKRWLLRALRETIQPLAAAVASETAYDALIPVPIDRERLLEREFNQAELIARLFAIHTSIPVKTGLLQKRHAPLPQSLLRKEEREANVLGAFKHTKGRDLSGKTLLLIDDILTSGATAEEAAACLKKAGARRVDLFVLAHAGARE